MIIGFTGTRDGMTTRQRSAVEFIIKKLTSEENPYRTELFAEHGDCVGADYEFNSVCLKQNIDTKVRPCNLEDMRAYAKAEQIAEAIKPMKRNQNIVDDATVMLACPPTEKELKRSGTWATIRMTRKAKKLLYIIFPNGKIQVENLEV